MGNGVGSSLTVSHDKTAGAEVDTAVIADDDNEDVRQFSSINLSENGFAGRRRRLAVVVGAKVFPLRA